jgi:hypothetical protein
VTDDDERELGLELEDVERAAEGADPRPEPPARPELVDMDTDEEQ